MRLKTTLIITTVSIIAVILVVMAITPILPSSQRAKGDAIKDGWLGSDSSIIYMFGDTGIPISESRFQLGVGMESGITDAILGTGEDHKITLDLDNISYSLTLVDVDNNGILDIGDYAIVRTTSPLNASVDYSLSIMNANDDQALGSYTLGL